MSLLQSRRCSFDVVGDGIQWLPDAHLDAAKTARSRLFRESSAKGESASFRLLNDESSFLFSSMHGNF